jgi:response regulator RpfG family c-di-GMP phosphodiesterase
MSNFQQITDARTTRARPLVLVADDDPDTRLLFRTVLEMRDYCVVEAADGEETVGAVERARPDLILMDGSLPRLSGLEAARLIRQSGQTGQVPIIFLGPCRSALYRTGSRSGVRRVLRETVRSGSTRGRTRKILCPKTASYRYLDLQKEFGR